MRTKREIVKEIVINLKEDFTVSDIMDLSKSSKTTVIGVLKKLRVQEVIFHVTNYRNNAAPTPVYSTVYREFAVSDKPVKIRPKKKVLDYGQPKDIFIGLRANLSAVDRFYRGSACHG